MASSNGGMKGIDATVFISSGGGVGATVEAARGRPAAAPCALGSGAGGRRRWPVRPCGWAGPVGRLRPSGGRGGKIGRLEKKERGSWLGRKAGWAESDGEILF
jgi:hypothetical protein